MRSRSHLQALTQPLLNTCILAPVEPQILLTVYMLFSSLDNFTLYLCCVWYPFCIAYALDS